MMTTTETRPIVVGVDDSPPSYAALDWAIAEATHRHAPLRLVHVVDSLQHGLVSLVRSTADTAGTSAANNAVSALERVSETIPNVTVASIDGDPADVLIKESAAA